MAWVPVRLGELARCEVTPRCGVRIGFVYECRLAQPELFGAGDRVRACGWHAALLLKRGVAVRIQKLLTWTWAK